MNKRTLGRPLTRPRVKLCVLHLAEYAIRVGEVPDAPRIDVSPEHQCAGCVVVVS